MKAAEAAGGAAVDAAGWATTASGATSTTTSTHARSLERCIIAITSSPFVRHRINATMTGPHAVSKILPTA